MRRAGYAGAFASTVQFATPSGIELQAVPFVGYAWRNATGVNWEAGADYSFFTGSDQDQDYPEVYVGVASENLSARLYYSTRYFGEKAATIYGELNGSQLLLDRVRLLAHVGILQSTNGNLYYGGPERLLDGRVGIGIDFEPFNVQLSWVGINAASATYGDHRNTKSQRAGADAVVVILKPALRCLRGSQCFHVARIATHDVQPGGTELGTDTAQGDGPGQAHAAAGSEVVAERRRRAALERHRSAAHCAPFAGQAGRRVENPTGGFVDLSPGSNACPA